MFFDVIANEFNVFCREVVTFHRYGNDYYFVS